MIQVAVQTSLVPTSRLRVGKGPNSTALSVSPTHTFTVYILCTIFAAIALAYALREGRVRC